MPGPLDRNCQLSLVLGTIAGAPAGKDLAPVSKERTQHLNLFVIDILNAILAEDTHLPPAMKPSFPPGTTTSSTS